MKKGIPNMDPNVMLGPNQMDDILNSLDELPAIDMDLDEIWDQEEVHFNGKRNVIGQKEINYERKKSRAKISRQEVNVMFAELTAILNAPESKRRNRAKLISLAIEKICDLQHQLKEAKNEIALLNQELSAGRRQDYESSSDGTSSEMLPMASVQRPYQLPTYVGPHPPHTQLLWLPCPFFPMPSMASAMPPPVPYNKKKRYADIAKDIKASTRQKLALNLLFVVENCAIFSFLDPISLSTSISVCKRWAKDCSHNRLWKSLFMKRWRTLNVEISQNDCFYSHWRRLHASQSFPIHLRQNDLPIGRKRGFGVDAWVLLSHRSNSRTNRAVHINGILRSASVVELRIMIQNIKDDSVSLDLATIDLFSECQFSNFSVMNGENGANFLPRILSINELEHQFTDGFNPRLFPWDVAVYSVFVLCPGCEFEEQFLRSSSIIRLPVVRSTKRQKSSFHLDIRMGLDELHNYARTNCLAQERKG